jgi:hypothetical protein
LKSEAFPTGLGADDVVYVYGGHGVTNRDSITWPGDSNPVDSGALTVLLKGKLAATFNGRVKIYSCYSGSNGKTAFGKRVADKMREAGYVNCRYFGYTGEITQQYEKLSQLKARIYKGLDIQEVVKKPHRFVIAGGGYSGRASAEGNRIPL